MKKSFILLAILAFSVLAFAQEASDNAANKVHAVGSTLCVFGGPWPHPVIATLLSTEVKTSDKADLLIEFNAECAVQILDLDYILDYLTDFDFLLVNIMVWIEVDGNPVPVDPTVGDDGQVVFYDLVAWNYKRIDSFSYTYISHGGYPWHNHYANTITTTEYWENQFKQLRETNSFKWFAYDVGYGTHTIEVKARLVYEQHDHEGFINGAVCKRTLVVEPLNNLK